MVEYDEDGDAFEVEPHAYRPHHAGDDGVCMAKASFVYSNCTIYERCLREPSHPAHA